MKNERIPKIIYRGRREKMRNKDTGDLLRELNLEEYWDQDCIFDTLVWRDKIKKKIHEREEKLWREECLSSRKLRK